MSLLNWRTRQITCIKMIIRMESDFQTATIEARRQLKNISNVPEESNYQSRKEKKNFSDKQKQIFASNKGILFK